MQGLAGHDVGIHGTEGMASLDWFGVVWMDCGVDEVCLDGQGLPDHQAEQTRPIIAHLCGT